MKLLLPVELSSQIEPRLPEDVGVVHLQDGEADGSLDEAEVYLHWWSFQIPDLLDRIVNAAPRLRWVQIPAAGVERFLTPATQRPSLVLTNGSGLHAIPIAEFVLAAILAHAKRLGDFRTAQQEQRWNRFTPLQELWGAKLLIIGLGGIGQAIAERANAFGMSVWGSRRHPSPFPGIERVVGPDGWRELLSEADYVVIAAPFTSQTHNLIDEQALRSMRPDAYLVNIARGQLIDEVALERALREGWIAWAALDTFVEEPLPADHPFWNLPNLSISPHTSASSPRIMERIVDLFLDNLSRYRSGQPLLNIVDKQAGY
jgi:phosphoglycerate dehydrogenase-like enzyme